MPTASLQGIGHRQPYLAHTCKHTSLSALPALSVTSLLPLQGMAPIAWLAAAGRLICGPLSDLPAALLQGMARAALSDGNLQQLACPSPGCRLPLPASLVPHVLRGKRQQGRFLELLAQQHIAQHPLMRW